VDHSVNDKTLKVRYPLVGTSLCQLEDIFICTDIWIEKDKN